MSASMLGTGFRPSADCGPGPAKHVRLQKLRTAGKSVRTRSTQDNVEPAVDAVSGRDSRKDLEDRIRSGEFSGSAGPQIVRLTKPIRNFLAQNGGRPLAHWLARNSRKLQKSWSAQLPVARGSLSEIAGQPFFLPLYSLYRAYGPIFELSFGPRSFVVVSDPNIARQVLLTHAKQYSKGLLSEILEFVMGNGLIPADGEIWRRRRRAILPSIHKKFVSSMIDTFGESTLRGMPILEAAAESGTTVDMENFFSRVALDIIGKAVFNYDFNSVAHDDPVIEAVYTVLREAESRSMSPFPWWNFPFVKDVVPQQRRVTESLDVINRTLDMLVARCKELVQEEDAIFTEEFLGKEDPSILHFLIASGEEISTKQLRDDLMTLLIAGHETTAAVLTWTFYELAKNPAIMQRVQQEVDEVLGGRAPGMQDMRDLKFCTRVINEAMRLYPQPPVLIRKTLEPVKLGKYDLPEGTDIFISVWNLHRSPDLWDRPAEFNPDRFPLDGPSPNEATTNFKYLPFGGGKRKCIGDQFAMFESLVCMAMILQKFDICLPENAPEVSMTTGATIHTTNGLNLNLTSRTERYSGYDSSDSDESDISVGGLTGTYSVGDKLKKVGKVDGSAVFSAKSVRIIDGEDGVEL